MSMSNPAIMKGGNMSIFGFYKREVNMSSLAVMNSGNMSICEYEGSEYD